MPYGVSFSREAVQKNDYAEFSLPRAAYVSDMIDIVKTEEQMTKNSDYAIFPIIREGKLKLVAGFPSANRAEVLPIIRSHQKELSKIFIAEMNGLKKHLKNLKSNFTRMSFSDAGDFVGGMLGGLLKSMTSP